MIDHRINARYRYGFVGGPQWNTLVTELRNGQNIRNKEWAMPKHKYTADYATLNDAEKEAMLATFWVAGGAWESFRFKDWNDWRVTDEVLATPVTSSTPIQLTKAYTFGPGSIVRTIRLPLNVTLAFAGTPFTDFTVDPLTGVCTPTTTWPVGTPTWSGEFDVCVRFSSDFNPFNSAASDVRECTVDLEEEFD